MARLRCAPVSTTATWPDIVTAVATALAAGAAWFTAWLAKNAARDSATAAQHSIEALARAVQPAIVVSCMGVPLIVRLNNASPHDAVDVDVEVTVNGMLCVNERGLSIKARAVLQFDPKLDGTLWKVNELVQMDVLVTFRDSRRFGHWRTKGSGFATVVAWRDHTDTVTSVGPEPMTVEDLDPEFLG